MIRNDNRMVKKGLFVSEVDARCCEYIYIFFLSWLFVCCCFADCAVVYKINDATNILFFFFFLTSNACW